MQSGAIPFVASEAVARMARQRHPGKTSHGEETRMSQRSIRGCAACASQASQRCLLVSAFLAGEWHAELSLRGLDAVGRAALAACGLDPGLALLDGDALALHRLLDEPLGFLAHLLL